MFCILRRALYLSFFLSLLLILGCRDDIDHSQNSSGEEDFLDSSDDISDTLDDTTDDSADTHNQDPDTT